jgi:enoyl-CoA hydratase/carnithine racemase
VIALEREGALWRIVIDRPDKANALTRDMLADVARIARDARGQAQVLVLTGRGAVFSAGADLDAARAGLAVDPVWEEASGAIAALNGTLAGGAFGMALACDLRVCVEGAKFFYPVMKLGFRPQPSDPARLVALVGPARARLILMGSVKLPADAALAFGLVDRVVPADGLEGAVAELSAAALGAAPDHVRAIKAMTLA